VDVDLWSLYRLMLKSRLVETEVIRLWEGGLISGEMHLGIGEEGVAAAVVSRLRAGDAMALDHRGTPALVMRGIDLVLLFKELLGRPDGLCAGRGGHMHLFSPELLAASSGIVGASGPAAAGFALAAKSLRPGCLSVAFFGEAAMNQGMLMESLNLAVVWKLPVLFVCKDNGLSITTLSAAMSAGSVAGRAASFGMQVMEADGADVREACFAVDSAMERIRGGAGPAFLLARCVRPQGHFLGDQLARTAKRPVREMARIAGPLVASALRRKGAGLAERASSAASMLSLVRRAGALMSGASADPVAGTRRLLAGDEARLRRLETEVGSEVESASRAARGEA
jgi:pyruvate dehydrogenase E1 component alpha subunit